MQVIINGIVLIVSTKIVPSAGINHAPYVDARIKTKIYYTKTQQ
jgi:hypothetical protein